MKNRRQWIRSATAFAAALLVWGCDGVGLNGPGLEPSPMVVQSTSGLDITVVYEKDPAAQSVSATIDSRGGAVGIGKHVLWVSRGAVDQPTVFQITRAPELPLRVKLTASVNSENDIGAAGFNAPVLLGLSLGNAANVPDDETRKKTRVIYYREDGLVEELDSRVYGHLVVARVPHFSIFGLGWP